MYHNNKIHETAIIGNNVTIGTGNIIEAYSIIKDNTVIGNNNVIGSYVIINDIPKLPYMVNNYKTIIGDNNYIGNNTIIDGGGLSETNKYTIIGNYNRFYARVYVGHDCKIGDGNTFVNDVTLAGKSDIRNNILLYGFSKVYGDVCIGDNCVIGAESSVTSNIPPYTFISPKNGTRAIKINNMIFLSDKDKKALKKAFKTLYCSRLNRENIIKELENIDNSKVKEIIKFIKSYRSIINGSKTFK